MKLKYILITLAATAITQAATIVATEVANVSATGGDLVDSATGITYGTYTLSLSTTTNVTISGNNINSGNHRITADYGASTLSQDQSLNAIASASLTADGIANGYTITGFYLTGTNGGFFGRGGSSVDGQIELTLDKNATLEYSTAGITWTEDETAATTISSGTTITANDTIFSDGGVGAQGASTDWSLTHSGSTSFDFLYYSDGDQTATDSFVFNFTATVPEPTSAALLGLGGLALLARRKR